MSLLFSVYSREAFHEFILPPVNNSDYSLVLHKDVFSFQKDIPLKLEVRNNSWFLYSTDRVIFQGTGHARNSVQLHDKDVLKLKTAADEDITIFVKEKKTLLAGYEKYGLDGKNQIRIGRNPENDIVYNNYNMVSAEHAVLRRQGVAWFI